MRPQGSVRPTRKEIKRKESKRREELIDLAKRGFTRKEAALELGLSIVTIHAYCTRWKISFRFYKPDDPKNVP